MKWKRNILSISIKEQNWKNQILCTKNIKGLKSNPKIKRIRIKMKNAIYNQFQSKDTIETYQNLQSRNKDHTTQLKEQGPEMIRP